MQLIDKEGEQYAVLECNLRYTSGWSGRFTAVHGGLEMALLGSLQSTNLILLLPSDGFGTLDSRFLVAVCHH
jgi:hypothetical protein